MAKSVSIANKTALPFSSLTKSHIAGGQSHSQRRSQSSESLFRAGAFGWNLAGATVRNRTSVPRERLLMH